MLGVYPIAKILTLKGTRRLVSLAQNDRVVVCEFKRAVGGAHPYSLCKGRFGMRDVREAVPYVRILIRWLLRADVGMCPY